MEKVFTMMELLDEARRGGEAWGEFFRVPAMSLGIYRLEAGADDQQTPHSEDEIYYVVSGRGQLRVEGRDHVVAPGSILFVPAGATHHFHEIKEPLTLLVIFAPAEGSTPG
jgi:mannose-6-phosphate isomerase-like protein (cupin superfamily)